MKPVLNNTTSYAFDATKEHIFEFSIPSSNIQPIKNILTIRNNLTNDIVYNETITSLQLKHILPKNTLNNGVLYNVSVKTVDKNNDVSEESDKVLFYCFSTPNFNVNIIPNEIIETSSVNINIIYSQNEGEELQSYQLYLYNQRKELLFSSGLKYNIEAHYTFGGLTDNTQYYIKALGQTINYMDIETDYIPFTVNYINPTLYSYVQAENRYEYGDIQISSNLVSIEGISDNPIFVNNDFIDTVNGNNVEFNKGFCLDKDMFIYFNGYNFQCNEILLNLSNINNGISLYWREINNKKYVEVKVDNSYIINSNQIDCDSDDIIGVWLYRVNNYYDISISNESEVII